MSSWVSPSLIANARAVAQGVLDRGEPPEAVYPVAVGAQFLYLSADRANIVGVDDIDVGGTVFYLGFRKSDVV
jgi:hypothetical protein